MIPNKSFFMITCKQSTEWVIKKEHKNLSVKENLLLLSHMAICSYCRLFQKQSAAISKTFSKIENKEIFKVTSEEKKDMKLFVHNKINK